MKRILTGLKPVVRQMIRLGYLLLLIALAGYAAIIYRQLQALRQRPVALPNYAFYVVDHPEKASVIQVVGSWIVDAGTPAQKAVQTTSLECRKIKLNCIESTAVVTLEEGGYLETTPLIHEIEQWNETELVTRPSRAACTERVVRIDIAMRKTTMTATRVASAKACNEPAGTFTLGSGASSLHVKSPEK